MNFIFIFVEGLEEGDDEEKNEVEDEEEEDRINNEYVLYDEVRETVPLPSMIQHIMC